MRRILKLCVCSCVLLALAGCMSMRTNTKPIILGGNAVPDLNVSGAVALKNGSSSPGEAVIGKWAGWTVYGDYHKFTDTAIGTARSVLAGQNIAVANDADRTLELEVTKVASVQGAWMFRATAEMKVKLGSGKTRSYSGYQKHGNGYGTTSAIEKAIAKCVEEMFRDGEVLSYLRRQKDTD